MNYYKLITAALVLVLGLESCKQDNLETYSQPQNNVFFNFSTQADRDSITYTFAYTPTKQEDTLYLPIGISGNVPTKAMSFKVAVTDSGTTAVAGLDYQILADSFTVAAGQVYTQIPIILYNKDTLLQQHSVAINLHLTATSDLGVKLADIITARVIFSDKLEEPVWWTTWLGTYSDEKFELFIIATNGVISMPSKSDTDYGLYAPQALYYVGLMNSLINDPAGWLIANPNRGYVLEEQPDGSYFFYNTATPSSRLKVVYDPSANRYYFVQQIGGYVTPN